MTIRRRFRPDSWLALLPALLVIGAAGDAQAQIGSGWTEFFPEKSVQLRGAGARYTNDNGIETFSIQPGDERSEARIADDHRTGTWQFEGYVNVKPGVSGGSVHQVFKFLMIVAYPDGGGELRQHSYQKLAANGIYDKWVRVNTIHDPGAGRADVYIDGTWRGMVRSASPGPNGWYHKYGIYNSSSTSPVVMWRNVRFWKDGKGDVNAQATDAGLPSADGGFGVPASDAGRGERPADARAPSGTGGAGGSGGGFGVGGTGGSGEGRLDSGADPGAGGPRGSGGGGGSGGSSGGGAAGAAGSPSGEMPAAEPPGCGCRVGQASAAEEGRSGAAALLVLLVLARAMSRRRRRVTVD